MYRDDKYLEIFRVIDIRPRTCLPEPTHALRAAKLRECQPCLRSHWGTWSLVALRKCLCQVFLHLFKSFFFQKKKGIQKNKIFLSFKYLNLILRILKRSFFRPLEQVLFVSSRGSFSRIRQTGQLLVHLRYILETTGGVWHAKLFIVWSSAHFAAAPGRNGCGM